VCSLEGGAPMGVSLRMFPNVRRECMSTWTPYVNNSSFVSSLLSYFIEKKYFHGIMGTYKIGGVPPA